MRPKIGEIDNPLESDPLIQTMLEEKELVSLKDNKSKSNLRKYHIAIPLVDINNKIYGAILVQKIHFFALKENTLTLLAVMAGHIGNLLHHEITNPVMTREESPYFNSQVQQVNKEAQRYKLPSYFLKIKAKSISEETRRLFEYLTEARRGLDVYLYDSENQMLLILMPLSGELEKNGFIMRVNEWAKERTSKSLEELGIVIEQQIALPVSNNELTKLVALND